MNGREGVLAPETVIIGYIKQPGILDVQYMAQNIRRNKVRGIIVFQTPPTYNVNIRAIHGDVELVPAGKVSDEVKKLSAQFKAKGYDVVVKNLMDVRDGMRDPM